jgi:hypothetical protein
MMLGQASCLAQAALARAVERSDWQADALAANPTSHAMSTLALTSKATLQWITIGATTGVGALGL